VSELASGSTMEVVLRKLDDEGKNGLIIYGPAYRPIFRNSSKISENVTAA